MKEKNIIIAGAGLFGCTCARVLAEAGYNVTIYDRRDFIGGNCATYYDRGIEVHRYGCHIFHTDSDKVWEFMNRFTKFNQYQHHCVAIHDSQKYFMPMNMMLCEQFFKTPFKSPADAELYIKQHIKNDIKSYCIDPGAPKNFEEQAISLIGVDLYRAFIENYTRKQWNCDPRDLDASIIKRLPIRYNYNISYYNDKYQGIPLNGYGSMLENMVNHQNIQINFNKEYGNKELEQDISSKKIVIFTGAPDELFEYKFGNLPWRSLRFETEAIDVRDWQGNSTVNYVDADVPYTRIHEFKHFHPEDISIMNQEYTVIQKEFPDDWRIGKERYYPINNTESQILYRKYIDFMGEKYGENLIFGGRLGMYKYFDMDDTVDAALNLSRDIINK